MTADLFTPDFKAEPYWWDITPRPALSQTHLPAKAEVVVIGSGYTGLSAALQCARGGRETLVLDAEAAGWGCSSRNGGQISTSIKPGYAELARKHGPDKAFAIAKEGHNALAWIGSFVREEKIDCDFRIAGRFHAAHNPAAYETLARNLTAPPPDLRVEAHMVPREEQRGELGTDAYHGGALFSRHCAVDPGKLHQGFLAKALEAGAKVVPHCTVLDIAREKSGFRVQTSRGPVLAREVVIATNGYSGPAQPWIRRRVIPIGSYIIATEPLEPALMERLMPRDRIVSDSRRVVYYYRASPDRRRILFGGRVSLSETDPKISGPRLHADMVEIFPELAGTRISHSWVGFVAYTFDSLAHIGSHEGLHYAMGYCGSGVSMAGYLGMRMGQQVLGLKEGATGFDGLTFQTRPLYKGRPWFLAPSVFYYRWRDRLNA